MDIRRFGIAVVGYVLVFGAFAVTDNLAPAFLITGATSLLSLLTGIALFPPFRVRFTVTIPSTESERSESYSVMVAGADLPLRPYIQVASCSLIPRHISELVGCALIAGATLIVVGSGAASYRMLVTGWGLLALEGACMAGAIVLLICLGWVDECRVLRGARPTLAPISWMQSGLGYQRLTYEFFDRNEDRYGGYTGSFGGRHENAVVVFYKPDNPNHNRAHRSLLFHKIQVHSIAPLRLTEKLEHEQVPS
ncbi:MAG TPA: hypothetical protein VIH78_08695 [Terriglobales bacterium]